VTRSAGSVSNIFGISVVIPATKCDFSGFRSDLPEIFGRESLYSAKISGTFRFLKISKPNFSGPGTFAQENSGWVSTGV
jgi:hypothetical protein